MSDVIRNAIIKLAIQLQSPNLTVPGVDQAIKQQQELAKATAANSAASARAKNADEDLTQAKQRYADAVNAVRKAETDGVKVMPSLDAAHTRAVDELTKAYRRQELAVIALAKQDEQRARAAERASNQAAAAKEREAKAQQRAAMATQQADAAYLRAGAAAINFGRGAAFIAAGSSEAVEKLLPMMFAIEGTARAAQAAATMHAALTAAYKAEAIAAGTAAVATSRLATAGKVLAAVLNPVVIAAGLVYVIYNRLNSIYRHFVPTQDEVNKRLEDEKRLRDAANQALDDARQRYEMIAAAKLEHIDLTQNESQKLQELTKYALGSEFLAPREQLQAARQALGILDSYQQKQQQLNRNMLELVKLRERDLKTAQDALKVAQDKDLSERAHIGALTTGEQKRLGKLTDKLESGQQLTKREALELQKLGGDAGQKIGEKFLATLDGGLGQRLEKLAGDPVGKAQAEFERKQAAFNKTAGGKTADQAVQAINDLDETISKSIDAVKETFTAKMHEFTDAILQQQLQQSRQQSAARAENAATGVK